MLLLGDIIWVLRLVDALFVVVIVCVFDDLVLCMFAFGG